MATHPLDLQALEGLLNSDPEFVLQARYLTTRIRVVVGEIQSFRLIVVEGRVEIDPVVTPFDEFDINMEGTAEHWEGLLSPVPPAFYQDFFPAMLHHGFRLEGDMATITAYYPAIRRMYDLFRQVSGEKVAA
jgi:hypothetical protein